MHYMFQVSPLTFRRCLLLSPIATATQLVPVPAVDVEGGAAERRHLEGPSERRWVTKLKGGESPCELDNWVLLPATSTIFSCNPAVVGGHSDHLGRASGNQAHKVEEQPCVTPGWQSSISANPAQV